jgi:predicted nucleotidyltransferase
VKGDESVDRARAPARDRSARLTLTMFDALRAALEQDSRISYALVFGSQARATDHPHSDVDVAVGLVPGCRLDAHDVGALIASLESSAGRPVDLVLLEESPPGLAYRVFRDGRLLFVRDRRELGTRLARAILEYLDFKPMEALVARGALAGRHGR